MSKGGKGKSKGRRGRGKRSPYTKGGSGTVAALKSLTVPDRMLLKLPYYADVRLTKSGASSYTWNWNLNSIYDPDRTGTGHQPLGYDQWGIFYNRYRVYGVQFDVTYTNMTSIPCRVFNTAGNEGLTSQDESMLEQAHIKSVQLAPAGSGKDTMRIKKFYSIPRIMGRPTVAYKSDDRYGAQWGANPDEVCIGTIGVKSLNTALNVDVLASVRIVFLVEAYDRHPMALSNTAPLEREGIPSETDSGQDVYHAGPTGPTGPTGPSGLIEVFP